MNLDLVMGLVGLVWMFFALMGLIKTKITSGYCSDALEMINQFDSALVKDELFKFHTENDINLAFSWRVRANPFKWKFKHYYPRLAAEIERRENLNKEK